MAAVVPDLFPNSATELLLPVVSSGFAWGLVALLAAMLANERVSAIRFAIGALSLATVTYYTLIVFLSRRWYHKPDALTGGESWYGLLSVIRSAVFWVAASGCAGLMMGVLADIMRRGSARNSTVATGVAFGLLAGQGTYGLFHIAVLWAGPFDAFAVDQLRSALIQMLFVGGAFALVLWNRERTVSWPALALSLMLSTMASATIWHAIVVIRTML
ncbi:hypothetical protein [Rhizomonospora bruguierae]|uniref:hypothetical protein n=1 Tax=Rhizomonospora bruguierae TaxID=1581705 RepID=UPI001BCE2B34|nr:hypothetical protein [Micromonospora sp. NBRC 107566]